MGSGRPEISFGSSKMESRVSKMSSGIYEISFGRSKMGDRVSKIGSARFKIDTGDSKIESGSLPEVPGGLPEGSWRVPGVRSGVF